jgi:hypothetical protein
MSLSLFQAKHITQVRNESFGRIEFKVSKDDFEIVRPFIENHNCEILLKKGKYYIIVHNEVDDWYNSNLIAELHDTTFGKLPNLSINEAGGLGVSNFPLKYRARRHCEEPYFEEYGYSRIGEYDQEKLHEYFMSQAEKEVECNSI